MHPSITNFATIDGGAGATIDRLGHRLGFDHIDIWQAIRPNAIGIDRWPHVPRGEDWKTGVCARLGVGDPPAFWTLLLASVTDYTVLESSLIAAVEGLLDSLGSTD